jgi:hypothetical protein
LFVTVLSVCFVVATSTFLVGVPHVLSYVGSQ